MLPRSTIEQWAVLKAVVDEGSFVAAAQALHRSQSSVSYAVARLRDAVGMELLEMQGRRAVLTEGGAALLDEVAPLIGELARIEQRGRGIAAGESVRIRMVVDCLFPRPRLFAALQRLAHLHPRTQIQLVETVRQTAPDLDADSYDLAILPPGSDAIDGDRIADVLLVAVAHAAHPLFARQQPPSRAALARHVRVEIRGFERQERPLGQGRRWLMSTVDSAIDTVRSQLGYAWLPLHLIEEELRSGTLRALDLDAGQARHISLGLHVRDRRAAGPATLTLVQLLSSQVA